MTQMMTTKSVAAFLNINEKMVYSLVSEKGLPATKVTGKWLFPKHLVEQWIEMHTINNPDTKAQAAPCEGIVIIAGSNDPLLERTIDLFNSIQTCHTAVFGNLGSMNGLHALRQKRCHIAASHLLEENGNDYNFDYACRELKSMPAVVNFCRREQGILLQKGNPKKIESVSDFARQDIRIVNRSPGTGTRLLLDRELNKYGIQSEQIKGYTNDVQSHINAGLEILSGRADAGIGIRAVAAMLGLDFILLLRERYDLMVSKERFFDEGIQRFLGMLHEEKFKCLVSEKSGYDVSISGQMLFPDGRREK